MMYNRIECMHTHTAVHPEHRNVVTEEMLTVTWHRMLCITRNIERASQQVHDFNIQPPDRAVTEGGYVNTFPLDPEVSPRLL